MPRNQTRDERSQQDQSGLNGRRLITAKLPANCRNQMAKREMDVHAEHRLIIPISTEAAKPTLTGLGYLLWYNF